MSNTTSRMFTVATLPLLFATLLPLQTALQTAHAQQPDTTYIAVVTGADVNVRSGASESYYSFARVSTGDMVQVMGEKILDEKSRWARITTQGPAFRNAYGYIKIANNDAGKFRIAEDGKTGTTLGRVDVIAPNLEQQGAAKDSWKPLVRLEAEQTVQILETTPAERDTIYKVVLPEGSQGWISLSFLRKATDAETAQYKAALTAAAKSGETGAKREAMKPAIPKPTDIAHSPTPQANTPTKTDLTISDLSKPAIQNAPPIDPTSSESSQSTGADEESSITGTATESTVEANKPTATTKPAAAPHLPTLDELEGAYKLLQKEPIETAEVVPLRDMYLDLGKRNPSDKRIMRYVNGRADQLQIWADLQKKQLELADIRGRLNTTSTEADAVRKALESSERYTGVGRISASTLYDGQGLPKLLRLQDAATGRTVAYLQPDEKYELANLIGTLVGIVGDKTYDGSLRLNIIQPRRIDVLTTEKPQAVGAETTRP